VKTFSILFLFPIHGLLFFRINQISKHSYSSIFDLLSDGSNTAFVTDSEFLSFLEKSSNGTQKFTKLSEKILSNPLGFQFISNDFMFKPFNQKIVQLVESGIADMIIKNESSFTRKYVEEEPPPLTLDHLGVWFEIWIVMLSVAGLSFIVELGLEFLKDQCKTQRVAQRQHIAGKHLKKHGNKVRKPFKTKNIVSRQKKPVRVPEKRKQLALDTRKTKSKTKRTIIEKVIEKKLNVNSHRYVSAELRQHTVFPLAEEIV
jgi:hypothetical protein